MFGPEFENQEGFGEARCRMAVLGDLQKFKTAFPRVNRSAQVTEFKDIAALKVRLSEAFYAESLSAVWIAMRPDMTREDSCSQLKQQIHDLRNSLGYQGIVAVYVTRTETAAETKTKTQTKTNTRTKTKTGNEIKAYADLKKCLDRLQLSSDPTAAAGLFIIDTDEHAESSWWAICSSFGFSDEAVCREVLRQKWPIPEEVASTLRHLHVLARHELQGLLGRLYHLTQLRLPREQDVIYSAIRAKLQSAARFLRIDQLDHVLEWLKRDLSSPDTVRQLEAWYRRAQLAFGADRFWNHFNQTITGSTEHTVSQSLCSPQTARTPCELRKKLALVVLKDLRRAEKIRDCAAQQADFVVSVDPAEYRKAALVYSDDWDLFTSALSAGALPFVARPELSAEEVTLKMRRKLHALPPKEYA